MRVPHTSRLLLAVLSWALVPFPSGVLAADDDPGKKPPPPPPPPPPPAQIADTVFRNGSIYTLDRANTKVRDLAVKDGIITFVGDDASRYIGPKTTVINLLGRAAIPGLVDSHMHVLAGGQFLLSCNLNYQPLDLAGVLSHIQGCVDSEPEKNTASSWLEVVNLDYPSLSTKSGAVTKANLDGLRTVRPILVRSSDYHTVWINTRALSLSGITASTPDPPGGKVERLPGSQEPSGILDDEARSLVALPPATPADNIASADAALRLLREAGITTFQDAASIPEVHGEAFAAVKAKGGLTARAYFDYKIDMPNTTDAIPALINDVVAQTSKYNDKTPAGRLPTIKWQAIKAFLDGVITYPTSTGAVLAPYYMPVNGTDQWAPDNNTWPKTYWTPSTLNLVLEQLILHHIDAQMHADGDAAVRVGLDAVQFFRSRHPGNKDYKVGLAHDELTDPADWGRFADLGVDAIMSYQWAQPSAFWIPQTFASLGPRRINYLEAWGEIAKRGRPIVYGSDWPIDPLDEWLALKAGVTRSGDPTNSNSPASQDPLYRGVLLAGLSLSRVQALRSITIEGAGFLRAEDKIGSLEKGKLADVVVLRDDFFTVPDEALGRQKVLLTMLGGRVLFVADGAGLGNVTAAFPNNDGQRARLARRHIGGFGGSDLSEEQKLHAAALRRRGVCDHGARGRH